MSSSIVARSRKAGKPVPVSVGGRTVGRVAGKVFYKSIRGSVHLLQKPRAIAFDLSTLRDAQAAGAVSVQVTDTESGAVYRAGIDLVFRDGFRLNRGHGDQQALPLDRWNRADLPQQATLFDLFASAVTR